MFFAVLCMLTSCFRKEPATPPDASAYDPQLPVTHSIAQLQAIQQNIVIAADMIISGVVVMNDEHGNYFNKIIIQDQTGGIAIGVNQSHLYRNYPVGRKIYVKCKGLFLGNDRGNLQLGSIPDEHGAITDIPENLIGDFIVKANYPNPVVADTVTLAALSDLYLGKKYLNKLVTIRQAEFAVNHTGIPYAQPADIASSTILTLKDCAGTSLSLRTSAYAQFQSCLTPPGNGYITGVYTCNSYSPQLSIRDTADVQFTAARCDGTLPGTAGLTSLFIIRNLCPAYTDSIVALPAYRISGVVISDKNSANIAPNNMVIQQADKGILIRFSQEHLFLPGDSVIIDLFMAKLSWTNNLLQVSNIPLAKAVKTGWGKTITPKLATIAEILAHYREWESTLVKINNAVFSGSGTYSGYKTISDGSGTFTLYTRNAASFAGNDLPGDPKNITGIFSVFNDSKQLQLRNAGDVE